MNKCSPDSCSTGPLAKRHRCPVNGKEYALVSMTTIKYHIKEPWNWSPKKQGFYFCNDPACNVVYFGQDDSIIEKSSLRTAVGLKENSQYSLVCYCFGVTVSEAKINPDAKAFVLQETSNSRCACETLNPSGRCCLSDFPKT